jgi:Baseplate J-like protein
MNANDTCGCCEGIQQLTPLSIANRPGLDALVYRVGTYASFLETMLARLSNLPLRLGDLDAPLPDSVDPDTLIYPLQGLTTRDQSDPAIAMLAAWATVADVLTFYQERIANEGYLRTATERRSILELARLVGYVLRPGVAASVFLAYTLEKDHTVLIPLSNRAQSVPHPGELPQSFETAEKLEARAAWNALKPRLTRPQPVFSTDPNLSDVIYKSIDTDTIYLQGTATKLAPGDALLLLFGDPTASPTNYAFLKVSQAQAQSADKRTLVQLASTPATTANPDDQQASGIAAILRVRSILQSEPSSPFATLVGSLSIPPSLQPRNAQRLGRTVAQAFSAQSDVHPQVLVNANPLLQLTLYSALGNTKVVSPQSEGNGKSPPPPFQSPQLQSLQLPPFEPLQEVMALRVQAAIFGHNLGNATATIATGDSSFRLPLDAEYKDIATGEWVVIEQFGQADKDSIIIICQVLEVQILTMGGTQSDSDLSQFSTQDITTTTKGADGKTVISTTTSPALKFKVTVLRLSAFGQNPGDETTLSLASTIVYVQSEKLPQAEEPIEEDIEAETTDNSKVGTDTIELDGIYDGLKSGQRLIVSGERTDVFQADGTPIPGIQISELVMLAAATQGVAYTTRTISDSTTSVTETIPLPGDKKHTFLKLAQRLAYTYKRDTVTIFGNVVRATHGETRNEVLGSGDATKELQSFTLRQSPLTYVAATTTSGVASSLQVRVNDILWHEVDSLPGLTPTDRDYITETDDADKTTVIFGNGQYGSRLPTGVENVKAVYRTGIGQPGNVQAGQISQVVTKPLGVKGVTNPLRASGGADRESIISARRNVPLATLALDRLVSVQDYADFARTFAGIGKASADSLSNGRRQLVYLTIAGANNIPIDPSSDLYQNLVQALHKFGDPHQPLQVDIAEVLFVVISAHVRLLPNYELEAVEPQIRAALLDTFSFERRELGQPVFESEVLSVIQAIAGVDYVDLEILGAVDQDIVVKALDQFQQQTSVPEEAGEVEEPGESAAEEQAEEFLELLGLTGHADVIVEPAQQNPNPPPPPKAPKPFLPAQLVFLTPDIPDTLIITELPQ